MSTPKSRAAKRQCALGVGTANKTPSPICHDAIVGEMPAMRARHTSPDLSTSHPGHSLFLLSSIAHVFTVICSCDDSPREITSSPSGHFGDLPSVRVQRRAHRGKPSSWIAASRHFSAQWGLTRTRTRIMDVFALISVTWNNKDLIIVAHRNTG